MLTVSSPRFSSFGCTLEEAVVGLEPIDYYYCHNSYGETSATTLQDHSFPQRYLASPEFPQRPEFVPEPATHSIHNHRPVMTQKHNHNACERDRRKRINDLYSLLRSLLPLADRMKRLSIPSTISRVLKYIPELQGQVEKLIEKKEQLSSKVISHKKRPEKHLKMLQPDGTIRSSSTTISAANVEDGEIVVQISASLTENRGLLLSKVLLQLEEDGFGLINISSTESIGGRVFLSLHLQDLQPIEGTHRIWCDELSQKLLSFFDDGR